MVAGVGVALEPPHTCRRLLGEVELHAVHLGDQLAAAPGMVEACTYGMRSAEAREWVRCTQERLGVGSVCLAARPRTGPGHGTAQAPRLDFEPCVPA